MKHYLGVEEHKEIGKKLKNVEESLLSLLPLINKFPKTSKVAKKFHPLYMHIKELKSALDNDLPFENTNKYTDHRELTQIYCGGKKDENL